MHAIGTLGGQQSMPHIVLRRVGNSDVSWIREGVCMMLRLDMNGLNMNTDGMDYRQMDMDCHQRYGLSLNIYTDINFSVGACARAANVVVVVVVGVIVNYCQRYSIIQLIIADSLKFFFRHPFVIE